MRLGGTVAAPGGTAAALDATVGLGGTAAAAGGTVGPGGTAAAARGAVAAAGWTVAGRGGRAAGAGRDECGGGFGGGAGGGEVDADLEGGGQGGPGAVAAAGEAGPGAGAPQGGGCQVAAAEGRLGPGQFGLAEVLAEAVAFEQLDRLVELLGGGGVQARAEEGPAPVEHGDGEEPVGAQAAQRVGGGVERLQRCGHVAVGEGAVAEVVFDLRGEQVQAVRDGEGPAEAQVGAGEADPAGGEVHDAAVEQGACEDGGLAVLLQDGDGGVEQLQGGVDLADAEQEQAALLQDGADVGEVGEGLGAVEQFEAELGATLLGLGVGEGQQEPRGQRRRGRVSRPAEEPQRLRGAARGGRGPSGRPGPHRGAVQPHRPGHLPPLGPGAGHGPVRATNAGARPTCREPNRPSCRPRSRPSHQCRSRLSRRPQRFRICV